MKKTIDVESKPVDAPKETKAQRDARKKREKRASEKATKVEPVEKAAMVEPAEPAEPAEPEKPKKAAKKAKGKPPTAVEPTKPDIVEMAGKVQELAEAEGLHPKDVVEMPDVLAKAGLKPEQVPAGAARMAESQHKAKEAEMQAKVAAHNKRFNPTKGYAEFEQAKVKGPDETKLTPRGKKLKAKEEKLKAKQDATKPKKPAEKPVAASKGKQPAIVGKGPGVIATIVEMLKAAGKDKPVSRADILKKLVKAFPDRGEQGMKATIGIQVPKRLNAEKGLKIKESENGFWIS